MNLLRVGLVLMVMLAQAQAQGRQRSRFEIMMSSLTSRVGSIVSRISSLFFRDLNRTPTSVHTASSASSATSASSANTGSSSVKTSTISNFTDDSGNNKRKFDKEKNKKTTKRPVKVVGENLYNDNNNQNVKQSINNQIPINNVYYDDDESNYIRSASFFPYKNYRNQIHDSRKFIYYNENNNQYDYYDYINQNEIKPAKNDNNNIKIKNNVKLTNDKTYNKVYKTKSTSKTTQKPVVTTIKSEFINRPTKMYSYSGGFNLGNFLSSAFRGVRRVIPF